MYKSDGFKELIKGSEATRHHHKTQRIFHEHRLAHKEVTEVDSQVDVVIHTLFERKLDPETNGRATSLRGALVGSLHHAGSAARNYPEPFLNQQPPNILGQTINWIVTLDACGAKDRHARPNIGEGSKPLNKLCLNPHDTPWILPRPC